MAVLQAIYTYPLKSAAGVPLSRSPLEPWGLAHDRRWMLVDPGGRFVTGRALGALVRLQAQPSPDGLRLRWHDGSTVQVRPDSGAVAIPVQVWRDQVLAQPVDGVIDDWLSERLGRPLRLVYLADPLGRRFDDAGGGGLVSFADGLPLLAISTRSLQVLSSWVGRDLDLRRFRPNLVIDGLEQPFVEDRWSVLRIGGIGLRMVRPCSRCIFTTVDPDSGERDVDREPLSTLEQRRMLAEGACFGVNLMPWPAADRSAGELAIGDRIEVLEQSL
ncbi:MAG: MOSC domain-containing protein [Xanthomonadales bacterium]|nr:MOSC domain-containing protein [Xanthomonadales bacterium]